MKESFNLPQKIVAKYKIITPMFLGDANKEPSWISPLSFKGVLRFWWRASVWGKIRRGVKSDEAALRELHKKEAELFGSSAGTEGKKGKVSLRIVQPENFLSSKLIKDWPLDIVNNPSSYLGYGIIKSKKNNHRKGFPEGLDFEVELFYNADLSENELCELKIALRLLGLFGGLGSRSRRGFGSVQLVELDGEKCDFQKSVAFERQVESVLNKIVFESDKPSFSAFGEKKCWWKKSSENFNNPRLAHAKLGEIYWNFRKLYKLQDRIVFGLPLTKVEENIRRSSLLFFHIAEFEKGKFGYVVLCLPTSIFHKEYQNADSVKWDLLDKFKEYLGEN